jgi:hypothetical protein
LQRKGEAWSGRDAVGLPIFPAIVRDNECARGMVADVMQVTVSKTRRAYVLPATLHKVKGPTSRWSKTSARSVEGS